MDFEKALINADKIYSNLKPKDIVKLAYQSEFGCGHLIQDFDAARDFLSDEWDNAKLCGTLYEEIGDGNCRINIGDARKAGLSLSTLFRMFAASARQKGTVSGLCAKLDKAMELAKASKIQMSHTALCKYVDEYKAKGCPVESHSAEYRKAYSPSYRVVDIEYCKYLKIFIAIDKLLQKKCAPIIGIDGNAAAGKTTLAQLLSNIYPCSVIHADSFFLPQEKRTVSRLSEIGGNIDYERLKSEVLDNLPTQKDFTYNIFDCSVMKINKTATVCAFLPVIIEGSYSLHPYFKNIYDLRVFLHIDANAQSERIMVRNGSQMHERFINTWIPMEQRYFDEYNIEKSCEIII